MLKKTLMTVMLLILATAPVAFALSGTDGMPSTSDTFKYNLSSNVSCLYLTDTNKVQYAMACKHKSGTRIFAVTNNTAKVYYKEVNTTAYIGETMTGAQPKADVANIGAGDGDVKLSGTSVNFSAL